MNDEDDKREERKAEELHEPMNDVLRKMLNTPPKPHKEQKQKKEKPAK